MRCPECGKSVPKTACFCPECGKQLARASALSNEPDAGTDSGPDNLASTVKDNVQRRISSKLKRASKIIGKVTDKLDSNLSVQEQPLEQIDPVEASPTGRSVVSLRSFTAAVCPPEELERIETAPRRRLLSPSGASGSGEAGRAAPLSADRGDTDGMAGSDGPSGEIGVSYTLATSLIPTAFLYQLDVKDFPLVTVHLDYTAGGAAEIVVQIDVSIEGYSDVASCTCNLQAGDKTSVPVLPVLKQTALATLNEIRPATLRVKVEQISPVRRIIQDVTERVHLHARNTALRAIKVSEDDYIDLRWTFAAWVTPHHPEVEKLLRRAVEYHPDRHITGWPRELAQREVWEDRHVEEARYFVRKTANAIFTAMKFDAGVVYVNSPEHFGKDEWQVMQRIRLPSETLAAGGSANCIDGTVLFASLMELAGFNPLIVLVPGHAYAGWQVTPTGTESEFVETTMIAEHDFEDACDVATHSFREAAISKLLSDNPFDDNSLHVVDVAACRERGILPLE